jgi:uncharacterized protein
MSRNWKWIVSAAILGAIIAVGAELAIWWPSVGGREAAAGDGSGSANTGNAQMSDVNTNTLNQIIVMGQAAVKVTPDTAIIQLGVQTLAVTAQEAQTTNADQMQQVINKLKEIGVTEDQMATSGISLFPESDGPKGPNDPGSITRYRASNQITVVLPDVSKAAGVLDAAVGAGANSNGSVSFDVKDDSQYRVQAVEQAVKAARPKAEAAARALGVTLKGVKIVEESGFSSPVMPASGLGGGGATPIIPGQVSVAEQVRVVFTY